MTIDDDIVERIYELPENKQLREDVKRFIIKKQILDAADNCPMCAEHKKSRHLWQEIALYLFEKKGVKNG